MLDERQKAQSIKADALVSLLKIIRSKDSTAQERFAAYKAYHDAVAKVYELSEQMTA